MRRTDVVVGAVALAGCAAAFALTFHFTATTPAAMMSGMGAEFFPRLILAAMAVLAVCILFGIGNPPMETPAPIPPIVWITVAILAAYLVAVEIVGMWIASFVLVVGLGRLWEPRSLWRLSAAAAGLLLVIGFTFVRVLKGQFPEGWIARLWS
jgi:hypothetical protein